MWLLRRCRISTLCIQHIHTILLVICLVSVSILFIHRQDYDPNHTGPRDRLNRKLQLQDGLGEPQSALDTRPVNTRHKPGTHKYHHGRGLLDRSREHSNVGKSESYFRSTDGRIHHLPSGEEHLPQQNQNKVIHDDVNQPLKTNDAGVKHSQSWKSVLETQPDNRNAQNKHILEQNVQIADKQARAKPVPDIQTLSFRPNANQPLKYQQWDAQKQTSRMVPSDGKRSQSVPVVQREVVLVATGAGIINPAQQYTSDQRRHVSNHMVQSQTQQVNKIVNSNIQQVVNNVPKVEALIPQHNLNTNQHLNQVQQYQLSTQHINQFQHREFQQQQFGPIFQQQGQLNNRPQQQANIQQHQQQKQIQVQQQNQHHINQNQKPQQQNQQRQQLHQNHLQQQQQQTQQELERLLQSKIASNNGLVNSQLTAVKQDVPRTRDIVWPAEIDEATPEGYTWEEVDEWSAKVRSQSVIVMATGSEIRCGRPPNHYLELAGGIRMCARYREHHSIEIEGELFSFYLARLLDIKSVPPVVLSTVQRDSYQWSQQKEKIAEADWTNGKIVALTKFIPSLKRTWLPKTLNKGKSAAPLEVNSPELKTLSRPDLTYLAQWSDLIVFDYLTGHIDRMTNLQEGVLRHDEATQRSIWDRQYIHNLAYSNATAILWFLDNETGFRMSYRTLYHNEVDSAKYQGFHEAMLRSICIFRRGTVEKITELFHDPNPIELMKQLMNRYEPLAQQVHVTTPGAWNDLPELFKARISNVYQWMQECRRKLM